MTHLTAGTTYYSESPVPGTKGNYDWKVSFDWTDGFMGINQLQDNNRTEDRVLLSPAQIRALEAFIKKYRP